MTDDAADEVHDRLLKVVCHAVSHISNEALILAQFEAVQDERLPQLWHAEDDGQFSKLLNLVPVKGK